MAADPAEGDFDAVVVGSGAGGGAAAFGLTRAGLRTCVLEKGPHYRDEDFFHDEVAVVRRSFFIPSPFDEPNLVALDGGAPMPSADGWISCCVGGGTVHMGGWMFRLAADDVRGWPIAYEELARAYDEIEELIGVSGGDKGGLPPIAQHPAAEMIGDACAKLGRTFRQPARAILSAPYRGRQACHYCGFCAGYGCEVGAKSSTMATLLPAAQATGKLTLRAHARAERIETDDTGRARAVVWRDEQNVERRTRGKAIVLAAGAIQTARLMLLSGVGGEHVGRNLVLGAQSMSHGVYALPHPVFGAPGGRRDFPFAERVTSDADGVCIFFLPGPSPIFQAQEAAKQPDGKPPIWGVALAARLKERFLETRRIECETFTAFRPHDGCKVELDPSTRDTHGLAVATISAALHPETRAASDRLAARGDEVLAATGATRVETLTRGGLYWFLQAGTARMAKRPEDGVTSGDGQVFATPGLYVADGAALPSGGHAPFTLTILANALRIAGRIAGAG